MNGEPFTTKEIWQIGVPADIEGYILLTVTDVAGPLHWLFSFEQAWALAQGLVQACAAAGET